MKAESSTLHNTIDSMPKIDETACREFQATVWDYYHEHGRDDLPWRQPERDGSFSAYKTMVSELMLQQTQVGRVIPKYQAFLERFPDVQTLAAAEQGEVLRAWNGLGYNRRAKFLHQAASQIVNGYSGRFPDNETDLMKLPGVGRATANAIMAYAYNQPVSFIETNIRTVYIHHFFHDRTGISDKVLEPIIEQAVDREHPREWYWALMDYGTYLKRTVGNLNMLSISYNKQSKFEGSPRQIRGQIIRLLSDKPRHVSGLRQEINDKRLEAIVADLAREGLIQKRGNSLSL
jgi:A/G-specific adenine glycosylase